MLFSPGGCQNVPYLSLCFVAKQTRQLALLYRRLLLFHLKCISSQGETNTVIIGCTSSHKTLCTSVPPRVSMASEYT